MRPSPMNNHPAGSDASDVAAPGDTSFDTSDLVGLADGGGEVALGVPLQFEAPRPAGPIDPYVMIRQALRGRYGMFVGLVVAGAALGAAVGWKVGHPMYSSQAQVRIAYATPPVKDETDNNKWLGPYETIMRSQEQVITSRPIVEKALRDPQWQAFGLGATPADVRNFQKELEAARVGVTEHIRVSYASENPTVAMAGVNAIVKAYVDAHDAKAQQFEQSRRAKLQKEAQDLEARIAELEAKVRTSSQEFGVPDVEVLYTNTERRVALLETKTIEVQAMLSALRSGRLAAPQAVLPQAGSDQPEYKPLTPEEIAASGDMVMRQYLSDLSRITDEIEQKKVTGLLEGHAQVKTLRQAEKNTGERIAAWAASYNKTQALLAKYAGAAIAVETPGSSAAVASRPADSISTDLAVFNRLLDEAKTTLSSLAPKRKEVQLIKMHADQLRAELSKLDSRQSVLELEFLPTGRVEVIESGDLPQIPSTDPRKKYAVAGAMGGSMLPAGLVVLFGLLNRRYRYSDEAETQLSGSAPLLGILPSLPSRVIDPEQAAAAAQCVHQIRVMLQVSGGAHRHRRTVYLLTSATPGEGKTSFTVSLGLSFAAAGSRTLVIDCDLIGQRLTRGFNLGGVPGLLEALKRGTVRGFARKTASGLWVVPVGTADVLDACAVSSIEMNALLADARRYFDTIIIDSGPILGSVEATTVAPQADGVIFCVSRGQQPPLVEKALRHLDTIGAPVAGFVFNRAAAKDFSRSAHASSLRSIPAEGLPTRAMMNDGELAGRFGPLVQSVVSLLPVAREWADGAQESRETAVADTRVAEAGV